MKNKNAKAMHDKEKIRLLYQDALTSHYLRKGKNKFIAECKARRYMQNDDTF